MPPTSGTSYMQEVLPAKALYRSDPGFGGVMVIESAARDNDFLPLEAFSNKRSPKELVVTFCTATVVTAFV